MKLPLFLLSLTRFLAVGHTQMLPRFCSKHLVHNLAAPKTNFKIMPAEIKATLTFQVRWISLSACSFGVQNREGKGTYQSQKGEDLGTESNIRIPEAIVRQASHLLLSLLTVKGSAVHCPLDPDSCISWTFWVLMSWASCHILFISPHTTQHPPFRAQYFLTQLFPTKDQELQALHVLCLTQHTCVSYSLVSLPPTYPRFICFR